MTLHQLKPETVTFDDWWALQIHKTDKLLCQIKWNEITGPDGCQTRILDKATGHYVDAHLKATPQELYDAQKRQNAEIFRTNADRQFLQRPRQWLNRGGWMDG